MGRDWEEEELKRRRKEPLSMDTGFSGFWKRVWHRAGDTVGVRFSGCNLRVLSDYLGLVIE